MARAAGSSASKSGKGSALNASMRIVVLTGKDSFLRVERARQLAQALETQYGGVDRFEIDGASTTLAAVHDELRSFGLLSPHKLVILDNAEVFMGVEERRRAMERYAENPQPESTLLMRASGRWSPGKFDKLVEAAGGVVLKCDAPSDADAVRWCAARADKEHKVLLEPAAAELLVEKLGPDLSRLDTELSKLAAASNGQSITRALVAEFVGLSREEQAWEIQGVMLRRGTRAALEKLNELVHVGGVPEVMIGWSIVDILRKVHDAARMLAAGQNDFAIAKQLRLWGEAQSVVIDAARKIGPHAAARLLDTAVRTDARTKSGWSSNSARTFEGLLVTVGKAMAVFVCAAFLMACETTPPPAPQPTKPVPVAKVNAPRKTVDAIPVDDVRRAFQDTAVARGAGKPMGDARRPAAASVAQFELPPHAVAEDVPSTQASAADAPAVDVLPAPTLPERHQAQAAETPRASEAAIFGKPEPVQPAPAPTPAVPPPAVPSPTVPLPPPATTPPETTPPATPPPDAPPATAPPASAPPTAPSAEPERFSLRRFAIASRVRGFGDFSAIDPADFTAGERVIAYFELAGWKSLTESDGRIVTEVDYTVQVLDKDGAPIWSDQPQRAKDISRTQRSDLFVTRLVKLPETLRPGRYALRVVASDPLTKESTAATLPFQVRSEPTK